MDLENESLVPHESLQENYVANDNEWRTHPIHIYENKLVTKESMKTLKKPLKSFYSNQNILIEELMKVDKYDDGSKDANVELENVLVVSQDHCHKNKQKPTPKPRDVDEILAKTVFIINLMLFIAKGAAAGMTGSLSIISSLLDSAIDLVSGIIMWWTARRMKRFNPYLYPQGRQRLEPVSIIILSVIMAVTSIQIVRESVTTIINMATAGKKAPDVDNISIVIICVTIVLKIVLWIVCRKFGTSESSAALAQDSRNDVFSNSVAVVCSALSSRLYIPNLKYLDPCGAIIIAIYILIGWIQTGSENVRSLTGHTASSSFLQKLTFIAVNHHPEIKFIDTVRAFHFGINFLVEVDIVLDENMPLIKAHDIGESLQKRIECLDEVERCFVHLDYEYIHDPKYEHKLVR